MPYSKITGHDNPKALLTRAFTSGKIPHAWLFTGACGSQNLEMAVLYSETLLCDTPEEQYCGKCESCRLFEAGSHPDFFHLKPRGKIRQIKMDDINELIKFLSLKSYRAGYKIIIVEEAENLPEQHANKLLKSLEEPPPDTVFILVCSREARLLPTIVSRCRQIDFPPLDEDIVLSFLEKRTNLPLPPQVLARLCGGETGLLEGEKLDSIVQNRNLAFSVIEGWIDRGKAGIIEQTDIITEFLEKEKKRHEKEISEEIKKFKGENPEKVKKIAEELEAHSEGAVKNALDRILQVMTECLRDTLLIKEGIPDKYIRHIDKIHVFETCAARLKNIEGKIRYLDRTRKSLQGSVNRKLALEALLLKIFC